MSPVRRSEALWNEKQQRWIIKVQADGERRSFADPTPGKRGKVSAERKADDWLEHRTVGTSTRCEVLLDKFLEKKKATTSTSNYRPLEYHIRVYIKPIIGNRKISHITEEDLQEVIDSAYAKGLSKKTLTNIRGTLTGFMKYCRKAKASTLHPEDLEIPSGAKRSEKHIAAPDDIRLLFSRDQTLFYGKPTPERCIHAYRFAVVTGLRFGELLGLRWTDLDGDMLTIRRSINDNGEITEGKNDNAHRVISVKGLAMEELDAQRAMLAQEGLISEYIFPDKDASFFQQKHFRDLWYRYCAHNGLTKITPYELRHTYVSVNDEMPDGLKRQAMGHSKSMDTNGVYGHQKAGDLQRIAEYSSKSVKRIIGNSNKQTGTKTGTK